MAPPNNIILYNYASSPFGARITAYLALRGIQYALCDQPFTMPRPDLALLPVSYRRIPLLAIGRDIYLDTRLILRVLESLPSSSPPLGATSPADMFTEQLLQRYMVEGPVFAMAAGLVPVEFVQDPTFKKDRRGMLGKTWEREELEEGRAESLNYVRGMCAMLEETILKDGRDWVLGARGPGMADIEAIFMLEFVTGMNLPEDIISEKVFPRAFAYFDRYRAAVEKAKSDAPPPTPLDGPAAAEQIHRSEVGLATVSFDTNDPTGLKEGTEVEMYPADWSTEYRDRGRLVGLALDEVTISVKSKGNVELRVHAPRTGFKIKEI